jgi:diacylglycerol kinase (ATP)
MVTIEMLNVDKQSCVNGKITMNNNKQFTLAGRIRSFRCAFNGVAVMLKSQHNAWIHLFVTIAVVIAGFCFGLTKSEWCWIVLAIVVVWSAEALNTAFEFLMDVASPEFHPLAGKAKDVAAGAVLIAAAGSVIIGCIVLGPYVRSLFR